MTPPHDADPSTATTHPGLHDIAMPSEEQAWRLEEMVILALTSILFFARLGARALWASEFRWAEIAREMLLTHNYFWPTINGRVYFDKPLGSYWLVIGATWITGAMNEAAARLPSAFAGLFAAALLIFLARRLYDLRAGVMAGFILATSFSFVFFSRTASADVETITGELAALLLFIINQRRPTGWWIITLWLIMAVTSLMKGLLGFVLPLTILGTYCCLAEGWAELGRNLLHGSLANRLRWLIDHNRWFFNWKTPIALALALTIYYLPFAISQRLTGSDKGLYMVYRENVERYFDPFDHRGPIYVYTYVIFALMAPWSALLPAALFHAHQRFHFTDPARAHRTRFALVFFWATFIFFTLSGSRRSYYILPILPAAAILIARMLDRPISELSPWTRRLLYIGYGVIVLAVVLSTLAFFPPHLTLPRPYSLLPSAPNRVLFGIFWLGSIAAIIYATRDFVAERIFGSIAVIAYLFMFYLFVMAFPADDLYRGEKPFAEQVRQLIDDHAAELVFYKNVGPDFYLDLPKPVPEYDRLRDLDNAMKTGSVHWIIVRRRELSELDFPTTTLAAEPTYPWDPREHDLNAMLLVEPTNTAH
ncbi:MAG TPA: glycosyltransferase family 39 protein [Candidatus Binataceae bacterium]|nr:glycosyltransferase family 39 protein [Candidatus Binataceae bacterium]